MLHKHVLQPFIVCQDPGPTFEDTVAISFSIDIPLASWVYTVNHGAQHEFQRYTSIRLTKDASLII